MSNKIGKREKGRWGSEEVSTGFQDNIVEEIKSRCNIVEVVGRFVALKKAGTNYKGVCPFHNEKTPSFVVSEGKQIFTCFGCGASGDVIEFVKRYHNLDFQETIEKLAGEYGIEIKHNRFDQDGRKAIYYEINRQAARFFYANFTQKANPGYDYMKKRGLDPATLKKFGIGYADEAWDSLYRYMIGQGVEVKHLLELGLVSESKGKYFDKFRDRVIFPIINTRGKVIGFGGRAIGDNMPKYLNSPESPVFFKKNNLYGLNLSRADINKEGVAILVEGYMDVISLYKHGVRNVSASLGTALTESQAAMLKRYADTVILSYDADTAGQAAALRGMDILRDSGCKVKVLQVTDGKDPDEFIKKYGKDGFLKLIKGAIPFMEYKLSLLRHKYDLSDMEQRVLFLQEAARLLREVSPVEADVYIQQIAKETHISEGAIRMEVYGTGVSAAPESVQIQERHREPAGAGEPKKESQNLYLEKNLIKLMLMKSAYIPRIEPYEGIFSDEACDRIYQIIKGLYRDDEEVDIHQVADSLETEEVRLLRDILENVQLADRDEAVFAECVARMETQPMRKREQEIIQILSMADEESDSGVIEALTKELMEIQSKMRK